MLTVTRAFVAGATGYTGREVVRALVARGVSAVAHVRPDSAALARWRSELGELGATIDTTPWEPQAVRATLERLAPTHVFALLGTTQKRAKADAARGVRSDYEAVDYGLTMMLVHAAAALAPQPKLIYLSATGVTARTRNPYLQVRHRVETELSQTGLPYAVARPSFITGSDRAESRPLERAGAAVADGLLGLAGALGGQRLRERYRSTDARALAVALVRIALDDARTGHVFESEDLR